MILKNPEKVSKEIDNCKEIGSCESPAVTNNNKGVGFVSVVDWSSS